MIYYEKAKEPLRYFIKLSLELATKGLKYQTETIKVQDPKIKEQIFNLAQLLDKAICQPLLHPLK